MKKRLRIAHIVHTDARQPDGIQNHVYYLTRELLKRGHSVDVYGCGSPPFYKYANYESLGKAVRIPLPSQTWGYISYADKNIEHVLKRSNRFDIYHIHAPYAPLLNWQLIFRLRDTNIITTFHLAWKQFVGDLWLMSMVPLLNYISTRINLVIYVSESQKRQWERHLGIVRQIVIPNGVDHSLYHPKIKKTNSNIRLLFVARLVKIKGLQNLLQALLHLDLQSLTNLQLDVVGDGPERKPAQALVRRTHLSKYVTFWGHVSELQKVKLYQEATIYIAPHIDEAFGLTILEAMACGVPIVGYKNAAFNEVLRNYPTPELLVQPKNITQLAQAIGRLVADESLRTTLRLWCIKESRKYSWEKVAQSTEKAYFGLLG